MLISVTRVLKADFANVSIRGVMFSDFAAKKFDLFDSCEIIRLVEIRLKVKNAKICAVHFKKECFL